MAEEKKKEKESRVGRMFSAGFSSAAAGVVTYPLDVIRMKVQLTSISGRELVMHLKKNQGIKGLYKGFLGTMARTSLQSSLRLELYEWAKRQDLVNSFQTKMAVASACGALGGFLATPIAKVQIRMQNNSWFFYKSLSEGLRKIYKGGGARMLFSGAEVSSLRGTMNAIGQIFLYDEAKTYLLRYPQVFEENLYTSIVASVVAGSAATLLQQPFEVVQVNLMNATPGTYDNSIDVFKKIGQGYGISGFYRGFFPTFIKTIPQTVITYIFLEHLRSNFGEVKTR